MKKQTKQYSAEEKSKIAIEALKGEMTMSQISSKYGVHGTQIHRWKQEAIEGIIRGFKAKTKVKDTSQEELIKNLGSIWVSGRSVLMLVFYTAITLTRIQ